MGQYYTPSNLDKMQHLNPYQYEQFSKLMESAWLKNNYIHTVINLLKNEWFGDRVIFCGDYAESGNYELGEAYFPDEATDYEVEKNIKNYYLVNLDKKIYCSIDCCPLDKYGWQINPLSLLLADGNGLGGGDYHHGEDMESVGSWAYDCIGVMKKSDKRLKEFKQVSYKFQE